VRAGKRSAPIVAALCSGSAAGERLSELLADGPPQDEDSVLLATSLIDEAGGLDWASTEADEHLRLALAQLDALELLEPATEQLVAVASYIVARDR
jgi:geranylgeranyl diphosphate synthase type I